MRVVLALALAFTLWACSGFTQNVDWIAVELEARAKAELGGLKICDPYFSQGDDLGLNELTYSPWAWLQEVRSGVTYYIIGAPWCPYCRSIYQMAKRGETNIEFRFILQDPISANGVVKMADLAKNGSAALERIFGATRYTRPRSMSNWDIEYFGDGAMFSAEALRLQLEPETATLLARAKLDRAAWASPVSIPIHTRDGYTFGVANVGMPMLSTDQSNSHAPGQPMSERELSKSVPSLKKTTLTSFYTGGEQRTQLYAFPDFETPSLCVNSAMEFPVDGIVNYKGKNWLRVRVIYKQKLDGTGSPISVSAYTPAN